MAQQGYVFLQGGADEFIDAVSYNGSSSDFQLEQDWRSTFADDGTVISLVTWIKPAASISGTNQGIFGLFEGTSDPDGIVLRIDSNGSFNGTLVFGIGASGSLDHRLHSTSFSAGTSLFTCIMICLEIGNNTGSAIKHMYMNNTDTSPTLDPASASGHTIPSVGYPVIGNNNNGGDYFNGCIGPIWMTDEEIDFSDAANRQKFTDAGNFGHIKDLGEDGSKPTGTQPKIYIKGNATNIAQHGSLSGSGTLTRGNLTNCATRIRVI